MNHGELQAAGTALLKRFGWRYMTVRRGRTDGKWFTPTSIPGWPDVFAWHPAWRRVAVVEFKVRPDRLSPEQHETMTSMRHAGIEAYVVYPEDLAMLAVVAARDGHLDPRVTSSEPPAEGDRPPCP